MMIAKAKDYVVMPGHGIDFYKRHGIGFEAHITRVEKREDWDSLKPFIATAHLPYSSTRALNIGSYDDKARKEDIEYLKNAILIAAGYGVDRCVIHTCGFESMNDELVGCYERMIDALKTLAKFAKKQKLMMCIENMVLRNPRLRHLYGSNAAEWLGIYDDVDESNVMLTLDTSHAASSVMGYRTKRERSKHLFDFLARPEIIAHIHWSDSRIATQDALFGDLHLVPGQGDLPKKFHREVKSLDAVRVFEQDHSSDEEALGAIAFVESL